MKLKFFPLVTALCGALTLTSCASKKAKDGEGKDGAAMAGAGLNLEVNADSDSGKAGALQSVYFPYDSSEITANAKTTLEGNADFLKKNPSVQVQIEGHCDERGSIQYNLALGEKRAKAVKEFLVALGVADNKLSTISYGKERPLEFGHVESAWSKNRRGNFVVTGL